LSNQLSISKDKQDVIDELESLGFELVDSANPIRGPLSYCLDRSVIDYESNPVIRFLSISGQWSFKLMYRNNDFHIWDMGRWFRVDTYDIPTLVVLYK